MINISKIYTYDNFIEDVKLKFPDSYTEYSFDGFINKTTFFTVKHNCKHNHQWTTKPYLFLHSKGCSKCRLKKYSIEKTKTHEQFCREIIELYGDEYTVIGIYINAITPIKIRHNVCGHEWNSIPNNFLRGKVCPRCQAIKRGLEKKKTTEQFKEEVYQLVGDEYKVISEYIYSREKILMKHNICGTEYPVYPYSFLAGARCPTCYGTVVKTQEQFEKEIYELFQGEYIVKDTYINTKTPIKFLHTVCNKESLLIPERLISGKQSCRHCSTKSIGEKAIRKYLENNNIKYKSQYYFKDLKGLGGRYLRFDFGILDEYDNLLFLIEYDGLYHFTPRRDKETFLKQQEYDKRKDEYCKNNNTKLIRIPYWEYKNINVILDELLK